MTLRQHTHTHTHSEMLKGGEIKENCSIPANSKESPVELSTQLDERGQGQRERNG